MATLKLPDAFKENCIQYAIYKSGGATTYNILYNQWEDALEYVKNLPEAYDTDTEFNYAMKKRDSYPNLCLAHGKYMCIMVILANIK